MVLAGLSMESQTVEDLNPFDEVFDDMFGYLGEPLYRPDDTPPPPPVPLDGGLTALLLAGGAAGYRQYTKRKG